MTKQNINFQSAAEHLVYLYRRGSDIDRYAEWLSEQFEIHGIECRDPVHKPADQIPVRGMTIEEGVELLRRLKAEAVAAN